MSFFEKAMFFALSDGNDISWRKGVSRKGVEASHLELRLARNAKKSAATTRSLLLDGIIEPKIRLRPGERKTNFL
jgi:hypothetical protein